MARKISNYIFSILALVSFAAWSQSPTKSDSVEGSFIPTGIRLGWDALGTVRSFASTNNFKGWEVNGDIDFRNYYLAVEVGRTQRTTILENGEYSNSGNYWRAGVDINLFKKDLQKNMLFLGFRIGHSNYDENLHYSDTTDFGVFNKALVNSGMKAGWAELTTGIKIKILEGFWMGYTARMKVFASYNKDQDLQSYEIPGYGLTYKKPAWGFSYYLMYRIPIRKEK